MPPALSVRASNSEVVFPDDIPEEQIPERYRDDNKEKGSEKNSNDSDDSENAEQTQQPNNQPSNQKRSDGSHQRQSTSNNTSSSSPSSTVRQKAINALDEVPANRRNELGRKIVLYGSRAAGKINSSADAHKVFKAIEQAKKEVMQSQKTAKEPKDPEEVCDDPLKPGEGGGVLISLAQASSRPERVRIKTINALNSVESSKRSQLAKKIASRGQAALNNIDSQAETYKVMNAIEKAKEEVQSKDSDEGKGEDGGEGDEEGEEEDDGLNNSFIIPEVQGMSRHWTQTAERFALEGRRTGCFYRPNPNRVDSSDTSTSTPAPNTTPGKGGKNKGKVIDYSRTSTAPNNLSAIAPYYNDKFQSGIYDVLRNKGVEESLISSIRGEVIGYLQPVRPDKRGELADKLLAAGRPAAQDVKDKSDSNMTPMSTNVVTSLQNAAKDFGLDLSKTPDVSVSSGGSSSTADQNRGAPGSKTSGPVYPDDIPEEEIPERHRTNTDNDDSGKDNKSDDGWF